VREIIQAIVDWIIDHWCALFRIERKK